MRQLLLDCCEYDSFI